MVLSAPFDASQLSYSREIKKNVTNKGLLVGQAFLLIVTLSTRR